MTHPQQRILVIRAGALGDLVMCGPAFAAIRAAHPGAEIALMTRAPFADFARAMPWFDRVIVDTHPGAWQWRGWARLIRAIREFGPDRVYDLQGKRRQSILYALLGGRRFGPAWSGAARGCAFPRVWPPQPGMHFMDFLAAQLKVAGVGPAPRVDFGWMDAPPEALSKFALPPEYVVLVPGCTPKAMYKRWPPEKYADFANRLQARGVPCVAVGAASDGDAVAAIRKTAPHVVDLSGRTDLFELAGILRGASCVVGNDTGPVHMAGAAGVPTLAVLSGRTDPVWSRPPGDRVVWRQAVELAALSVDEVWFAMVLLLQHTKNKG
ncbi:MAG: glycosyltransferase family 9 protein [Alphaproteobacteria bacterium]|nr:glycosyltransferase family 9 protein [Alphaproteobacteria bacterium]